MHYNESYIEKTFRETYERFKFPINPENEMLGYDETFYLEQEYPVNINNKIYFIDFYEPTFKIAIELDGYNYHEKDKKQIAKDKKRERDLVSNGFKVLRFTGSEVRKNPIKVLEEIYSLYTKLANSDVKE
jgi:hypothetical protein